MIAAGLGALLIMAAAAMLWEYRRLFLADPKSLMSAEVYMQVFTQTGGPGYLAAFLMAGALLSFGAAAYTLLLNVASYING